MYIKVKGIISKNFPGISRNLLPFRILIKFLIAGSSAAAVDIFLLYILTDFVKLHYLASAILAYVAAFFISFSLQKYWVFRDKGDKVGKQMINYFLVGIANLGVNTAGMYVLVDIFNIMYILAQIIMGGLIAILSFVIYRFFIFKTKKTEIWNGGGKKLLIAAGVFPPDVGGSATYAKFLKAELEERGYVVGLVCYGEKRPEPGIADNERVIYRVTRKNNIFLRYYDFFLAVWERSEEVDAIIAFDLTSSGIPAVIAAKMRGKKIFVRLGGDFLWEKAFARGWTDLPLQKFYKQKKNCQLLIFYYINFLFLKLFDKIIFTSDWQRMIYSENYKLLDNRTAVIKNSFFDSNKTKNESSYSAVSNKHLIFAGRLIGLKNLDKIIDVIAELDGVKLDIYGDGPDKEKLEKKVVGLNLAERIRIMPKLPHEEFLQKLHESYVALVPALSEISPVTMMECIKLGKPVLVTKNCGYYEDYKNDLMFIDPTDKTDIKGKIEDLFNESNYKNYLEKIKKIDTSRDYKEVMEEWLELIYRSRVRTHLDK